MHVLAFVHPVISFPYSRHDMESKGLISAPLMPRDLSSPLVSSCLRPSLPPPPPTRLSLPFPPPTRDVVADVCRTVRATECLTR